MFEDTSSGLRQWGITLHFPSTNQYLVQQLNSMNEQLQPAPILCIALNDTYRKKVRKLNLRNTYDTNLNFLFPKAITKMGNYEIIAFCPVCSNNSQIFLPIIQHTIRTRLSRKKQKTNCEQNCKVNSNAWKLLISYTHKSWYCTKTITKIVKRLVTITLNYIIGTFFKIIRQLRTENLINCASTSIGWWDVP